MKKILVISYFLEPCNRIAVRRPESIIEHLRSKSDKVVAYTRHWDGNENKWEDYLKTNISPPKKVDIRGVIYNYLPYEEYKPKFFSKVKTLIENIFGNLDLDQNSLQFKKSIESEILNNDYDLIYVSAPPNNLCKLAFSLGKKNNVPYVLDFRDFQNHVILDKNPKLSFKEKILHFITMYHMKKWIDSSLVTFSISEEITKYINSVSIKKCYTIHNGYSKKEFAEILKNTVENSEKFNLTILGTIYPEQNVEPFINSICLLIEQNPNIKLQINLIGTQSINEVSQKFKSKIPTQYLNITNRIPREEALEIGLNSHALFYIGWPNHVGIYSGKIFEYLGLRKNILIIPNDNGVMENLIKETNAGKAHSNEKEAFNTLNSWYKEWEKNGKLEYHGIDTKIDKYTREIQAETMFKIIDEKLKNA